MILQNERGRSSFVTFPTVIIRETEVHEAVIRDSILRSAEPFYSEGYRSTRISHENFKVWLC